MSSRRPPGPADGRVKVPGIRAAHVKPERRVPVGHQPGVPGNPQHPPVQAEHEAEELLRVPPGHQQDHRGDHGQEADQPPPGVADVADVVQAPAVEGEGERSMGARVANPPPPRGPQPRPGEQADDDVLRDGQQPPFHQRQPAGQPLRVLHLQVRGISGVVLSQRERRVPVVPNAPIA